MRTNPVENQYIDNIDHSKHALSKEEVLRRGLLAEQLFIDSVNTNWPGFEAKLSTRAEDSGVRDIGPKQIIDIVIYHDHKPAMTVQISESENAKIQDDKLKNLAQKPYMRLPEMKNTDTAIPNAVTFYSHDTVNSFDKDPSIAKQPETFLNALDYLIKSLKFDIRVTKSGKEQAAAQALIDMLEREKKKYIH